MDAIRMREDIHRLIYDALILAILKIIKKLDLSSPRGLTNDADDKTGSNNPDISHVIGNSPDSIFDQREVSKDFQIFVNLVEFSRYRRIK